MANWFKQWAERRYKAEQEAGAKKDIYVRGDVLYFLEPERQRVCKFTVKTITQDQHGIRYTGEWSGALGSEFWHLDKSVSHKDVHHDKYALMVQFVDNFKEFEYT